METLQTKGKSTMWKKYFMVFVLTFSNIVYLIPYLSLDFYNQFLEAYNLTDGQAGNLITFFGFTAVPGYFIGGWLADVFNPKKLIIASCVLTSAVAVGVAFTSSFTILMILYFLYGITSTCLNWSAYLKVIRMLGGDDEQGRLFGSVDIAYGLFSLFLEYGVLALTVTYLENHPMGFKFAILIYAAISVIVGIAIQFTVPKLDTANFKDDENSEDRIKISLIGKALKMPITWYMSFFTLGYFIIRSCMPYINPYLTDAFGVSVTLATAYTTTVRTLTLVVMSPLGGFMRDKLNGKATPIVMVGSIGAIVFSIIIAFIPQTASLSIIVMGAALLVLIFSAATTSCLYTPTSEGKVPIAYTGTVLGIASAIGYSSDIWLYSLCGNWLDNMGNDGYTYIWYLAALGGVMMVTTGYMMYRLYKEINK